MERNETKADVLAVMDHVVAVYRSMADRGAYPQELLPEDSSGKPSPLYLGVQGFRDVIEARAVVAELLEAVYAYEAVAESLTQTPEHATHPLLKPHADRLGAAIALATSANIKEPQSP
jgi:hypothetical protein